MNHYTGNVEIRLTSISDPLKILLIEDLKGDAILIEKALKQAIPEIHSVEKVTTLEGALKKLTENEFDVALLDRSLPDSEGFSGLHSIQNMSPELPVIFLTAYQDIQTAHEAIKQGAQDYLFKDKIDGHVIKRALQYAIFRKQFEGVLIMRANYDMLTGLANRILFKSRMDMALAKMKRQGGNLAILFLDLDRFKQINDRFGHEAGDRILKEFGKRLKQSLRSYDTAARLGGDEFAVLLENIPEFRHSEAVAQKIIELFDVPFQVSGEEIILGVSIGIANCTGDQALSAETLIQQADEAMFMAKSIPESAYRFFTPDISRHVKMTN